MASEYWIVVNKDDVLMTDWVGDIGELADTESDALKRASYFDEVWTEDAPHRVVPLVEAGSMHVENIDGYPARVLTIVRHDPAFEPEVAAVVRAAAEEADKMHHCDCATCGAVRDLKLNQLRACGVDNDKETDDD